MEADRSGEQPSTTMAPMSPPRTFSTCSSGSHREGRGDDTGREGWGSTLGFTGLVVARTVGRGTERGSKDNRECLLRRFVSWLVVCRHAWNCVGVFVDSSWLLCCFCLGGVVCMISGSPIIEVRTS